jgi:hypothetical protein
MTQGIESLSEEERAQLLRDTESVIALHLEVQEIRDPDLAKQRELIEAGQLF